MSESEVLGIVSRAGELIALGIVAAFVFFVLPAWGLLKWRDARRAARKRDR